MRNGSAAHVKFGSLSEVVERTRRGGMWLQEGPRCCFVVEQLASGPSTHAATVERLGQAT